MRIWSTQYYFLPTRNIDFYYSGHSNHPVNSFWFHVALTSDPPPFCKVPAECFCSVARRWKVTAGWHGNREQVTAGGGNSTHRSTSTPAPLKIPKPRSDLHQKDTQDKPTPSLSLVGLSHGWVKGPGRAIQLFPLRPTIVHWASPRLRVWRWGRRECFRRLTHHIQAQSHHPSWAPDGRSGLHSWWAQWPARASCPWCSRHWSQGFHRRPVERKKTGKERWEAERRDRVTGEDREGERGKSEGKGRNSKNQKKERRQQCKTECGKQVTVGKESTQEERWQARTFKETQWQQKRRKGRTDWAEVTYHSQLWTLWSVNRTVETFFFQNQQFPERANCIEKQQLRHRERKLRKSGARRNTFCFPILCLHASGYPSVLSAPREYLSGRIWISHWHLSLPHRAATINISANKVHKHTCMYSYKHVQVHTNTCTPYTLPNSSIITDIKNSLIALTCIHSQRTGCVCLPCKEGRIH